MNNRKGLFIVFEGIDGSGKSTQVTKLNKYLGRKSISWSYKEPTELPIGKLARKLLQKPEKSHMKGKLFSKMMSLLFAADRMMDLYQENFGILDTILRGEHIVLDRYLFSSIAYNSETKEEREFVTSINQGILIDEAGKKCQDPDVVFWLKLPPAIATERMRERGESIEVYEKVEKLTNVQKTYEELFESYTGKVVEVDASQDTETVHKFIKKYIDKLLEEYDRANAEDEALSKEKLIQNGITQDRLNLLKG